MRTADGVRASALTTPVVNSHSFLYPSGEPTIDMIDWYYRTPSVKEINVRQLDEYSSVVEVSEVIDNKLVSHSFTIGKKIKTMIYNSFIFYHPMETIYRHNSINSL